MELHAALENFKSNLGVLIVKKVVLSDQKTQVFHRSLATEVSKNVGSPNLSLAPLSISYHLTVLGGGLDASKSMGVHASKS